MRWVCAARTGQSSAGAGCGGTTGGGAVPKLLACNARRATRGLPSAALFVVPLAAPRFLPASRVGVPRRAILAAEDCECGGGGPWSRCSRPRCRTLASAYAWAGLPVCSGFCCGRSRRFSPEFNKFARASAAELHSLLCMLPFGRGPLRWDGGLAAVVPCGLRQLCWVDCAV